MALAHLSTRLPRIEAGPFATSSSVTGSDDWSEIEAILASPEPARRRPKRSYGLARGLAGIAALVATGGLAAVGLIAAEHAGLSGPAALTAIVSPPRTQVANAPAHPAVEEGRSVAKETGASATSARVPARPGTLVTAGSVAPDRLAPIETDHAGLPAPRHRHRHKH